MTPFELSLRNELDVERQRFGNEWLFKWHSLNIEGRTVDVERFEGTGRITVGGVVFGDQLQSIYWQAIGRYLDGKMHLTIQKWEQATATYPVAVRKTSLEGTGVLLRGFVGNVVRHATETDQALRGRGYPKTDVPRDASGVQTQANAEVHRLVKAHLLLMEESQEKANLDHSTERHSYRKQLEDFYANNKGLIWAGGVGLSVVGLLLKYFAG